MEPMARIELATSPLPRECSATELHGQASSCLKPVTYLQYPAIICQYFQLFSGPNLERVKGIEPSS